MTPLMVPVWTWRDAIRKADVPPLTKLVCLCIANYISDLGKGAFPSVKALMADSGMSNRSVSTHIQNAVDAGLLEIEREAPGKDGRFGRTTYYPRFPDNAVLKRRADRDDADDEPGHVKDIHADSPGEGGSLGSSTHVKEIHADMPGEEGSRGPREPGAQNRVKELHAELSNRELSNSPPKSPGLGQQRPDVCVGGGNPLDEVRADGIALHVVEQLLEPLAGVLAHERKRDPAAIPVALLRGIRDACAEFSPAALALAMKGLRDERSEWPSVAQARKAALAAQAKSMVRIVPGTPQWEAWAAEWARTGKPFLLKCYTKDGFARVTHEFPPASDPVKSTADKYITADGRKPGAAA